MCELQVEGGELRVKCLLNGNVYRILSTFNTQLSTI
jgi:hypothetical protein